MSCDCQMCEGRRHSVDVFLAVIFVVLALAGLFHIGFSLISIGAR